MSISSFFLLLVALITLNAFFSCAEFAIASAKHSKLVLLAEQNNARAQEVLRIRSEPTDALTLVQLGLNIIALVSGAFADAHLAPLFAPLFPAQAPHVWVDSVSLGASILLITTVFILFGELIPKKIVLSNPEHWAMRLTPPLLLCLRALSPIVRSLSWVASHILLLAGHKSTQSAPITFEEVHSAIDQGAQSGALAHKEHALIENVLCLSDRSILLAMTPKDEVIAIDQSDTHQIMCEKMSAHPHARFLLTHNESILGFVESKDLLKPLLTQQTLLFSSLPIQNALALPDTLSLLDVLESMQNSKVDFACVFNEFGMWLGIITLNDVLGTLMQGSALTEDPLIVQRADGSYLVDGAAPFTDVLTLLNLQPSPSDHLYQTAAGFLMFHFKRIPKKSQTFTYQNCLFEVLDVDGYRIDALMITKLPPLS